MTRLLLSALFVFLVCSPAMAEEKNEMTPPQEMPAGLYISDQAHTSVTWKVSHLGLSDYTARFAAVDARLDYNPSDPALSTLSVTIDPMSIRTDYPDKEKKDFDKQLATGEKWFNAGEHGSITYQSARIERTGENTARIHGTLSMLGVDKPLTLDVTFNGAYGKMPFSETAALGFSARTSVQRSLWGMDGYLPMIGDEVEVLIETELHKAE